MIIYHLPTLDFYVFIQSKRERIYYNSHCEWSIILALFLFQFLEKNIIYITIWMSKRVNPMKSIFNFSIIMRGANNVRARLCSLSQAIFRLFWIYCLFTFLIFTTFAYSQQWQFMDGPYGGKTYKFAIDPANPDIIYAAFRAGSVCHKSIDGGLNWIECGPDTVHLSGSYIALGLNPLNSNNVFLGNINGLFKSTDGGSTWVLTSLPRLRVTSVAFDPVNPQIMYAGIYFSQNEDCIWKSSDNGETWVIKSTGIPNPSLLWQSCLTFAINPVNSNSIYAGISYDGIYKTTNAGESWQYKGLGGNAVYDLCIVPWDTTIVFAATMSGLYKSTNAGGSWYNVFSGVSCIEIDTINQIIYAGTRLNGIYKSFDIGESWTQINNPQLPLSFSYAMRINDIAVHPFKPDTLLIGTDIGPYRSYDAGQSWEQSFNGIEGNYINDITVSYGNQSGIYSAGYGGGLHYFNPDSIPGWKYIGGLDYYLVEVDKFNHRIIYAAGATATNADYICRTIDGGVTWNPTSASSVGGFRFIETDPNNGYVVYCTKYTAVQKSMDAGANWFTISTPIGRETSLDIQSGNSNIIYIGSKNGVYRTTDDGQNWDFLGLGNFDQDILVKIHPQHPDTIYAAINNSGFYRSIDAGQTWEQKSSNLTNNFFTQFEINSSDGARMFLGTRGGGVFFSTDAGEEWNQITPLPPSLFIKDLEVDISNGERLLAAFDSLPGLYYFDLTTGISEKSMTKPGTDSYALFPNYPNPFNSQTFIEYYLPASDRIVLKIYDITGREVKTIVNGYQNVGRHKITWSGKNETGTIVSSGIYILKFLTKDKELSRKVLFLK